ncbi:hypothetical protein CPB86DRAFT_765818 [Serendipita vermifera]|nr:hypothetical protein CPB86DRAFT_765818 [Serendipita vermifera]
MSVASTNGHRIVSFDGSGLRTISQLEVFRNIMHRIQCDTFPEEPDKMILPCEYFDLMGGSDTGGLIALLFVKCCMSVDEVLDAFYEIYDKVYMDTCIDAAERSSRLRRCLEDILSGKALPLDLKLGQDARVNTTTKCAGFVVATTKEGLDQAILRTYSIRTYPNTNMTFIDAALSTCAAEPSFLPVTIGPHLRQRTYISGNISGVNPSKQVISEGYELFGRRGRLACFLSLGPGPVDILSLYPNGTDDDEKLSRVLQAAITDHKKIEQEVATKIGDLGLYFRFSAAHLLQGKEKEGGLESITTRTEAYLRDVEISRKIDACVGCCRLNRGLVTFDQLESSRRKVPVYKDFPSPTKYFVPRNEPWEKMTSEFLKKVYVGPGQKVMVISGMGGCGKTQLIAEFMKEYRSRFEFALFIDGSSRETIEVDIMNSVQGLSADPSPIAFSDALDFFRNPHQKKWILVYDNVDDTSLKIAKYLPDCQHGAVIITTQNQLLGQLASHSDLHIKLGPMSDEEAIDAIYKSSDLEKSEENRSSMSAIAAELGNLPVALVQAGSYILSTMCTPNEYLKRLQTHKAELMKKSTGDREDRSAYAAFELSYQRLSSPIRNFLHIMSHMHYTDFPLDLISHAAQYKFRFKPFSFDDENKENQKAVDLLVETFGDNENDIHIVLDSIVTALQNYSLATFSRTSVGLLLRIHPLNHLWSAHSQPPDEQNICRAAAACLIANTLTYKQLYVYLAPHITALIRNSPKRIISLDSLSAFGIILMRSQREEEAGVVWGKICQALIVKDIGKIPLTLLSKNIPLTLLSTSNVWYTNESFWRMPEMTLSRTSGYTQFKQTVYSLKDNNTLRALANYAAAYHLRRNYPTAEKFLMCVVRKMEENLGQNDEDTLRAEGELALVYQMQQKYSEAMSLQERVLFALEKHLGSNHPDVLSAMANLAITHRSLGNYSDALELQERILEKNKVQLGENHWETLKSTMNLAKTLHAQSQFVSAMKLQEKVWNERKTQLGESHPKTLEAMAHLAITYRSQGNYSSAETMQLYVLDQRNEQLRMPHPSILEAMDHLSTTYHLQGCHAMAAQLQEQVMKERTKQLGEAHPDTLRSIISLSITYRSQNWYYKAITMQKNVVEMRSSSLGKSHPETLDAMTNLSITYYGIGHFSRAVKVQEEVLSERSKRWGRNHPETLRAMLNLADTYLTMTPDKREYAMNLQKEVVEARTRLYGTDHLETLEAISRLAITYRSLGKYSECQMLQSQVLEERSKQLGEEHQLVQRAMVNLAKTHQLQGHYSAATQLLRRVLDWRVINLGRTHLDTLACLEQLQDLYELNRDYLSALILLNDMIEGLEVESRLESGNQDAKVHKWERKFMRLWIATNHLIAASIPEAVLKRVSHLRSYVMNLLSF